MSSHRLDISELDFENIKGSLKRFLSNQNEFKDYDFEGSSLAILLDLLAYNTHYLAYNANFVANEMFLDTAQLSLYGTESGRRKATMCVTETVKRETRNTKSFIRCGVQKNSSGQR